MSGPAVKTQQRFPIGFYTSLVKGDALEKKRPVTFYYHDKARIGNVDGVGVGPSGKWVRLKIGDEFRTFTLSKIQGSVTIGKCEKRD